jgi:GxxExxY protein
LGLVKDQRGVRGGYAVDAGRNAASVHNDIETEIVAAAMTIHSELGPGLLERIYEFCLAHELSKRGLEVRRQVAVPLRYDCLAFEEGYRIDLLVKELVVIEINALESILPDHRGQLLSYLRLGNYKLGYLLNFNVVHMRDGIKRLVNGL